MRKNILKTIQLSNMRMRAKLTLFFILITTVPLLATTLITSWLSHSSIRNETFQNNRQAATALAREMDQMLDAKIKLLMIMAQNPVIQSMVPEQQLPVLRNMANQYPDMTSLIIADHRGVQTVRTVGELAKIDDRDYFREIVSGANFVVSDVIKAKGTGLMSIVIAVPLKDSSNNLKGVLLGVVDLNYLGNYISQTKIGETGYAFVVDRHGKALAHPDETLIQSQADLKGIEAVSLAINGQIGIAEYSWQGEERLAGYSFVPMSRWGVVVQQSMKEAMASADRIMWTGITVSAIAILLAALMGLLAAGFFTKPITKLLEAIARLSHGDLSVAVNIKSGDEIGQLAESFNQMTRNLRDLVRQIAGTAEQVAASAQELSATSSQAEKAIMQITGTITDFVEGSHKQTQEVVTTVGIVEDLNRTAQLVAQKAHFASKISEEMATAAQNGEAATDSAVGNINEIKDVTLSTSQAVSSLGEKSAQIGQIVDTITGIAGQTNLLALNAAIEAARAGEQGRGFAVVADEVRKLAEQSEQAAHRISQIIYEIQEQTEQAIRAMQDGSLKVNQGVEVIKLAGDTLTDILAKVNNSVQAIKEIDLAVAQQVDGTRQVVSSTEYIAEIAKQSSANAEHTAAAAQQITASMGEIARAAQELAGSAARLQDAIEKFRL